MGMFDFDDQKMLACLPLFFVIQKVVFKHSWVWPSIDVIRWGLRGCADGEANRKITPEPG